MTLADAVETRRYRAAVAGASGYAGLELQRLLAGHPQLDASVLQARSEGYDDLDAGELAACDVVFLACRTALRATSAGARGRRRPRRRPRLGLPRRRLDVRPAGAAPRGDRRGATLVANPGCYATAAILALAPLAEAGLIDGPVAIDGKSGVSGRRHASRRRRRTCPTSTAASRRTARPATATSPRSSRSSQGSPAATCRHVHAAPAAVEPRPPRDGVRAAHRRRRRRRRALRRALRRRAVRRARRRARAAAAGGLERGRRGVHSSTAARAPRSSRPRSTTSSRAPPARRSRTRT